MSALSYRSVKKECAGIKHRETCDFVFHPQLQGRNLKRVKCQFSHFHFPNHEVILTSLETTLLSRQASRLVQKTWKQKHTAAKKLQNLTI